MRRNKQRTVPWTLKNNEYFADFIKGSRLVLNWHPLEDVTRSEVQLVFLAIQCAE